MGTPESETQAVFAHTNVILGLGDPEYVKPGTSPVVAALTAGKALADPMNELAKHTADKGGDDLTTALLDAELDGETLTQPDAHAPAEAPHLRRAGMRQCGCTLAVRSHLEPPNRTFLLGGKQDISNWR